VRVVGERAKGTRPYPLPHTPSPNPLQGVGRGYLEKLLGEPSIKRIYPEQPLVGVGAVVFKGGEVLLVRRGQEPARDSWSLPGGLVEVGETLEAAITRELAEETGVTVALRGITAVVERIFPDPDGRIAYHYVLVDFLCDYLEGELTAGSDITAARFVPLSELAGFDLPPHTAAVIRRAWEQKQQGSFLPLT
jgi:8-oxo-dGTP diphosphatase